MMTMEGGAQSAAEELARRGARLDGHGEGLTADGLVGDVAEHAGGFGQPAAAGQPVGALWQGPADHGGEEGWEGGGDEQPAPCPVQPVQEDPRQPDRDQQADRPEEVKQHKVTPAALGRQVFGEQRWVDHEHAPQADAGQEAEC